MNLAARDEAGDAGATPERQSPQRQESKLLGPLIEGLDLSRPLMVLEVGRAKPETIAFFSRFRCRIHVADLFSELASGALGDASGGKTLQRQFQDAFRFEPGTRLDLCLLWDFPHYLEERQLRAFSSALYPWLHAGTRAFGFGVHSAATVLLNREYGIVDAQTLLLRPRTAPRLPGTPHPQSFMNEWLTCFSAARALLLPDGRIETAFIARI